MPVEIVSVFRRPRRDVVPEETGEIFLRAGLGIDGDCHASPISPRQILLVSTGAYSFCRLPKQSLRENILVQVDDLILSSGSLVRLGPNAAIRITFECEPCGKLNRVKPTLSKDIRGKRGYLARVVRSGIVKPGDRIRVGKKMFPALSDNWRDRVISIARLVPADSTVSYARLAEVAGVPKSFCRTFPRLLRSDPDLPWQRIVSASQLNHSSLRSLWLGRRVFGDDAE